MHQDSLDLLAQIGAGFLVAFVLYEWISGKYRGGRKTREDWFMGGICLTFLALVQRPLLVFAVFLTLAAIVPQHQGMLGWIDTEYFALGLLGFMLLDEFLHGAVHHFTHRPKINNRFLAPVQAFYRIAHRPHHLIGGSDNRGELSVTHTYVEHWGWWLTLPNYTFGVVVLYLGAIEIFFWGTLIKTIWGMHVHTNWNYDLVLLNHPNRYVRKAMFALCHVITFPTMHQQHHSRGRNSAKNLHNVFSLFDWLVWGTLAIEQERPKTYGWRQKAVEEKNVLYRFFNTNLRRGY
ncbi:MAG: hypothetical protein WBG86_20750 [Polyangiales bacterium]